MKQESLKNSRYLLFFFSISLLLFSLMWLIDNSLALIYEKPTKCMPFIPPNLYSEIGLALLVSLSIWTFRKVFKIKIKRPFSISGTILTTINIIVFTFSEIGMVDNYSSSFYNVEKSVVYHLPKHFAIWFLFLLICCASILFFVRTRLIQNWQDKEE